jgi:hypothetical protein
MSDNLAKADVIAKENHKIRMALDAVAVPVRIASLDGTITYINHELRNTLRRDEAAFRATIPNFDASKVEGGATSEFFTQIQRLRSRDCAILREQSELVWP